MSSASEESLSREERLNTVIAEFLESAERGESPDVAQLLHDYPDLADDLREFFQDWRQFQVSSAGIPAEARQRRLLEIHELPRKFGNYEVLERVAQGGMGVVYKALQLPLNRTVAVKVLLRGVRSTPDEVRRFQAEAESAAQLDHPGIVPIYEVGEHEGIPFFSMRYIAGENLADLVAHGPLEAREAARLLREIAVAVEFAHQRNVIHRDLKPSNVLLEWPGDDPRPHTLDGREIKARPMPRITDFGLAKRLTTAETHTQTGQILGTPNYMSPEQVSGQTAAIGPASDIYSLGALLYCLLTGRPPFQAADPLDTMRQVRDDEPIPPSRLNPSTPQDLETIALRCLEKQPSRRFATARALVEELDRYLDCRPILTRPVSRVERVVRWSRRQPVVAALVMAVTMAVLLGGSVSLYFGVQASRTADNERQRRRDLERSLYRSQVMQADLEWQTDNVNRADQLLDACDPSFRNWEWRFLKRRCHVERLVIPGHAEAVQRLGYSPDGTRIVSTGDDKTVRIWDAQNGKPLATWTGPAPGYCTAWSPDAALVAVGYIDGQVAVWEAGSGRRRFLTQGHAGGVTCVAFHPDAPLLATCGEDGVVKLLDTATGERKHEWSTDLKPALSVSFDAQGHSLAAAGDGTAILIWDVDQGQLRQSLRTEEMATQAVAFARDGERLLSAGDDGAVHIWDVAAGKSTATFDDHTAAVRALAINRDGKLVASGGKDGTVMIWDIDSGKPLHHWKAHHLSVLGIGFSPKGRDVASCGIDGLIRLWDLDSPEDVPKSVGHTERVNEVAFDPNGKLVASASKDGTVRLWDAQTAEHRGICSGHTAMVLGVAFARQGEWLVSAGEDGRVLRWDTATNQRIGEIVKGNSPVWSVDVHPDGALIATGDANGVVGIWNVDSGEPVQTPLTHQEGVKCVRFSHDGKLLATCGDDGTIQLWNVSMGKPTGQWRGHRGRVWHVAFSHDSGRLASSGHDGTAIVWDVATGKPEQTCVGHAGIVYAASFSPDGSRLATAGYDQTVKIWDLTTGLDLLTLREPLWSVNSVAFSPDGQTIASGSSDWRVRLWQAAWPRP